MSAPALRAATKFRPSPSPRAVACCGPGMLITRPSTGAIEKLTTCECKQSTPRDGPAGRDTKESKLRSRNGCGFERSGRVGPCARASAVTRAGQTQCSPNRAGRWRVPWRRCIGSPEQPGCRRRAARTRFWRISGGTREIGTAGYQVIGRSSAGAPLPPQILDLVVRMRGLEPPRPCDH